ncbi:SEC-C metal-binding domain-containing protein [Streptococcus anginosus]|uniref:SEC-C metal-binding domain-containing protein n=1 Tax=Streptococcus anginosus TaxID=1328 RepID=UPI0022E97E6D|nr:SEC-C metal-binding domain-containing protein [Streptococcus anginosus]
MTNTDLMNQVNDFHVKNKELTLTETDEVYVFNGFYHYSLKYQEIIYENNRKVKINVPKNFPEEPIELIVKYIPKNFEHIYPNGVACLATIGEIIDFLANSPTVTEFIEKFINPFFFTLEYFEEYGVFLFGEREHGASGLLSYYKEQWNLEEIHLLQMFKMIYNNNYRGHQLCFCGSNKKLRNCHGNLVFKIITNPILRKKFIQEVCIIEMEMMDYCQKEKRHKMKHLLAQKD